jgi:elongation factor Ts
MVDSQAIKEIREKTGASIMMIKKALTEAGGNHARALEVLKTLGHDAASKKESRETLAGRVEAYIHGGGRVGVLLELRSETDFVSGTAEFAHLAHEIAMHVAAMNPGTLEELLLQPSIKDASQTVSDLIKAASATFGEHVEIRRFVRYQL